MADGDSRRIELRSSDGMVSGTLIRGAARAGEQLLVCIHGGGCNGSYFDISGFSTARMARERGMAVLLLHRPGHGGNPPQAGDAPIAGAVPRIRRFIDEAREGQDLGAEGFVLLGQSIGAATAFMLAAARGDWPLRAMAASGIGDDPAPAVKSWWATPEPPVFTSADSAASFFLGPEGSYSWRAPIALRGVTEPWLEPEVREVIWNWPAQWPEVAAQVDVPVHLRLAQHDGVWLTSDAVVGRMAAALRRAPLVDAALLPHGGHLYEIHKRGAEFVTSQLDFLAAYR